MPSAPARRAAKRSQTLSPTTVAQRFQTRSSATPLPAGSSAGSRAAPGSGRTESTWASTQRHGRVAGLAQQRRDEEAAAHSDPPVNPPHRQFDIELGERVAPSDYVLVSAVDQRAVQVEQERGNWLLVVAGRSVTPATLAPPSSVGPAALAAPGRRGPRGTRGPGLAPRDELPVHPRAAARPGSGRDIPKLPGYPPVHVVRGDIPGHRRDGRPARALRQGQRMVDAQRQAFGVEGVERYGLAELGSGAGGR